VAPIWWNR